MIELHTPTPTWVGLISNMTENTCEGLWDLFNL